MGAGDLSDFDDTDDDRAPICPECGVTALPADGATSTGSGVVCENPDCDAFGDEV